MQDWASDVSTESLCYKWRCGVQRRQEELTEGGYWVDYRQKKKINVIGFFLEVPHLYGRTILNHWSSPLNCVPTLIVFRPKWWIHYNSVKLFGITLCLQRAQVTLDQIHGRDLKFLCISSEYVQCIVVDVEANAQTGEDRGRDWKMKLTEKNSCYPKWVGMIENKWGWPDALTLHQALQPRCWGPHSHIPDQPLVYPQCHQTYSGSYKACMLWRKKIMRTIRDINKLLMITCCHLTSNMRAGWILFKKNFRLFKYIHLL